MRAVLNTTNARIYSLQKHSEAPSRSSLFKNCAYQLTPPHSMHARPIQSIQMQKYQLRAIDISALTGLQL